MPMHAFITVTAADPTVNTVPAAGPTTVGYGAIVLGLGVAAYTLAKWQHVNKDARKMFVLGVVVAVLLGSTTGIFGDLSSALRETGNSVGNSVTDTTTGR